LSYRRVTSLYRSHTAFVWLLVLHGLHFEELFEAILAELAPMPDWR